MLGLILNFAARSTILAIVLFAALRLLRVRSPHVEMTVWTALLVGALAMPLLVALSPLTLPRGAIPWAETARAPAPTTGATAAQSEDEDGAPAARAPSASAPPAGRPRISRLRAPPWIGGELRRRPISSSPPPCLRGSPSVSS